MKSNTILMIAGEHSGDSLGANLIKEFKKDNNFEFIGIGGPQMISEGLESMYNIEDLSVIGFSGLLTGYFKLKKIANKVINLAIERNVKIFILIDYPGFNLELASMLKEKINEIKIIFYVSPQIWAWRFKRIFKIKKNIDLMLLLFPFEKKIYDKYGITNVVVGHPLVNSLEEELKNKLEIPKLERSTIITLMPGSRSSEIRKLLTILLDSAIYISEKLNNIKFLIPNINDKESEFIKDNINNYKKRYPNLNLEYHYQNSARCIEASDLVILSSGTATLEVAFFKKPMIIIYKSTPFTHFIGKRLLLIPYIGLVNILGEKFICKEFLQDDCNPKNITDEAVQILTNHTYRDEMIKNISIIRSGLGNGDSSKLARNSILKLISS